MNKVISLFVKAMGEFGRIWNTPIIELFSKPQQPEEPGPDTPQ
jgi:hypothetical protein